MTARAPAPGWLLPVGAGVLLLAIAVGSVPLGPAAVWRALVDDSGPGAAIVRGVRLPRVALAFGVGGTLAVAGAAMQAVVRNPLAEPYLLGLAGGAGLGAVVAIALGAASPLGLAPAAFVGALAAAFVVYRVSVATGRPLEPLVLILAGVVTGSLCAALMQAILILAEAVVLRSAVGWLMGSLGNASWSQVAWLAGVAALPAGLLWVDGRALDLLALGDEPATHLGIDVTAVRLRAVGACALLTAAAVSVAGLVGFVGLVVPHATRLLWGPLHRRLLPLAFVVGGLFLVLADVAARSLRPPVELPLGAVTALVGVPVFVALLRRRFA